MRLKVLCTLFLCILVAAIVTPARSQSQQDDQRVFDDFIRTRGSDFAPRYKTGKPKTARPVPRNAPKKTPKKAAPGSKSVEGNVLSKAEAETKAEAEEAVVPDHSYPIGLGYTIYKINGDTAEPVGPEHVFRAGDKLRLALETNADGYLYIFNTENNSNPLMLYPDIKAGSVRSDEARTTFLATTGRQRSRSCCLALTSLTSRLQNQLRDWRRRPTNFRPKKSPSKIKSAPKANAIKP